MKRYRLKAVLKIILTFCLISLILPVSSVYRSVVEVAPQQTNSLASQQSSSLSTQSSLTYPEDFDLVSYLNDNPNEYQEVWEPWLTQAAVHAIATSEDGDFLAVGGGYLYDNEVHIYRWNLETREYDKVWDSGDGIIKGDVLSLAFGDTDNNKFMDIAAGSADGHIYVFEQRHIYDPFTRTENQFEHVWTSPKMRPVFSVKIEDTDKDGVLDILAGSWDEKIRAYEYSRHSGYPFSREHWIEYEEVWNSGDLISDKVTAITTADTNYNGLPEIIAGTRNGTIYIFENDGAVLYIEGVPFPLTNDNKYVLNSTISGYIWKPILSLDSGDIDGDSDDEIVAVAAGQGVYVIDYTASGYRLNKLTRPLESWEVTASPHSLDYYVDDIVSATSVFYARTPVDYGWWPEPITDPLPPPEISPKRTAMAGYPDGLYSTFQPFLTFVANYGEDPWGTTPAFPDPVAKWIWDFPAPTISARVEEFWVTREFDLASSVNLTISVTVDNYYRLYIDETFIGNDTNWQTTETYNVSVSAGHHSLKMKVGNEGTEDNPAGLIVSVNDSESGANLFRSQGDGTWRTTATAVLDFGKDEEATGNGNDSHDLIVNFSRVSEPNFAVEPDFEELSFLVSPDLTTFAAIETRDLQFEVFTGGFYVYINLDRVLAEKRWDYARYLNITVDGNRNYAVDSIEAETLFRPLSTATTAVIRSLNLESQSSVYEFNDRVQAYSTGFTYEEIAKLNSRTKELEKLVIGTADGRLIAFGYNKASKSYDQIWDSYTEDWFNLETNIWALQDVKTLGKMPTWMLNQTNLDVPLSFKIGYPFENYASMTVADVNLDGSLDLIVGTKQGTLTSPTTPTLETGYFDKVKSNYHYGSCWVSAAFGQLNTSGIIELPPILPPIRIKPLAGTSTDTSASTIDPSFQIPGVIVPRFQDHLELVVGYKRTPPFEGCGLDYWSYPYEEHRSLQYMERTNNLGRILQLNPTLLPEAALEDMDGDDDVDITVTVGRIYYLENVGSKTNPSFELKPEYYSAVNSIGADKNFTSPRLEDFDSDGDFDLFVGFYNKTGATYFENTGTARNPVWVETRRLFYNSEYSFRNDNFFDPVFYDVAGLYDILEAMGTELPTRDAFLRAYRDTFGTINVMSAYNNVTKEIVSFIGDTGSHSRFLVGTNPRAVRLEVCLADGPLRNYGYHVLETWNNDADLDEWTITVASGDVDEDGKNEVIVGDFDNNLYVFEHLINNTYKRAFRSFDINHTVLSDKSPYAWEELEGLSGTFYRKTFDHVEHLIADVDLDNDTRKEIIAAADLSIYVFEWTGIDDQYKLVWSEDLRKSAQSKNLEEGKIEKISALSYHRDLDKNGYGEIIIGAGSYLFVYESMPGDLFVEKNMMSLYRYPVGYWNFDEGTGRTAGDSSGNNNRGYFSSTRAWEWEIAGNVEGWTATHQVTDFACDSGYLKCKTNGTDPFIHSPSGLGIDASKAKTIHIRMYASYASTAQIFFITKTDTTWNEAKSKVFALADAGSYAEYTVDFSSVQGWTGTITQIRLDLGSVADVTFVVDWLRVGNNPHWVAGKAGSALNFDGVDDNVATPFIPLYNRSFTVTAWINAKSLSSQADAVILSQLDSPTPDKYLHLVLRKSYPYFGFYADDLSGKTALSPNVWYHIAFVYNYTSNYKFIYVNGALDASGPSSSAYKGASGKTIIGAYSSNVFNGVIDDVRIYDRALSVAEIAVIKAELPSTAPIIQTIAAGDTDSDGYNEIVVGGASGQNGFVCIWENQKGSYYSVLRDVSSKWMNGSRVNTIVIDDQDYDGKGELIVGHEYGINILEDKGSNQYEVQEVLTSSPNYPKPDLFASLPWTTTRGGWALLRRSSDILQLSNGTVIQVYSAEDPAQPSEGPRLFLRTSNNNGRTWTLEKRVTQDTEYAPNPDWFDLNLTGGLEYEPSVTQSADGKIWFTWTLLKSRVYWVFAKYRDATGWSSLMCVSYKALAPTVWTYGSSAAVAYISYDGKVYYRTRVDNSWQPSIALPYVGQGFQFYAEYIDMVALQDGGYALAFEGRNKDEKRLDTDIWLMTANSTLSWSYPNRVTEKFTNEKRPSIIQLKSQETLVIAFQSHVGQWFGLDSSVQISYSKNLGRSWSEPEQLTSTGTIPITPSVARGKDEGFFYSFESTNIDWQKMQFQYGIFIGFNPSSDWAKYEIGNVQTLAVGDTDKDLLREIIANYKKRATVFEIKHTGASYQEHSQVWMSEELAEAVTDIAIGDGNGNGWPEIIIAADRGNVYSYETTDTTLPQTSLITPSKQGFPVSSQPIQSTETGDFDGDTKPDILTGTETDITASRADGTTIWSFILPDVSDIISYHFEGLVVADLNGDGKDDVASVYRAFELTGGWPDIRDVGIVYAIDGATGTQLWNVTDKDGPLRQPTVSDINGDGLDDIIVYGGAGIYGEAYGIVYAIDGATGTQLWKFEIATDRLVYSICKQIVDLNGDGTRDVVAMAGSPTPDEYIIHALDGATGIQLWNFTITYYIYGLEVGNLQSQTHMDVVATTGWNRTVYALDGENGAQLWKYEIAGGGFLGQPVVSDLNGDDLDDVIGLALSALFALDGPTGSQLWNNTQVTERSGGLDLADLNGDGTDDIIVGYKMDAGDVLAVDGLTGQTLWTRSFAHYSINRMTVLDFNGDGVPDIALIGYDTVARPYRYTVLMLLDGSDGSTISIVLLTEGAYYIVPSDFNMDGKVDIAIGTTNGKVYVVQG